MIYRSFIRYGYCLFLMTYSIKVHFYTLHRYTSFFIRCQVDDDDDVNERKCNRDPFNLEKKNEFFISASRARRVLNDQIKIIDIVNIISKKYDTT